MIYYLYVFYHNENSDSTAQGAAAVVKELAIC